MATKRALIVDDSKSARFVLKRMLNDLELSVDTVESALDALEYLTHHRPDVIFMDHMMPGMDGMEATRRIKENPKTAAIPILMYTSKGGEVYLSQVRALGAVGIIPKTIAPVDLKESLLELGLIHNLSIKSTLKIDASVTATAQQNANPEQPVKKKNVLDIYLQDLRKLMDEQTIELHRSMWLGIESVSHEIFNRLNTEFDEKLNKIYLPKHAADSNSESSNNNKTGWPLLLFGMLFIVSLIFNYVLYVNNNHLSVELEASNKNKIVQKQENIPVENKYIPQAYQEANPDFIKWAKNIAINYPFNELALNDSRFKFVDEIINRALQSEYKGRITLQVHVGKFCLASDQTGNYELEKRNVAVTDCEFIGNDIQQNDRPSTQQSLGFANYLAGTGWLREKGISIELDNLARNVELVDYPEKSQHTTAQQWNEAAQLNNRITVKLGSNYSFSAPE